MKRITLSLLVLLSFASAFSQTVDTAKFQKYTYTGYDWKSGKFDSALFIPKDTIKGGDISVRDGYLMHKNAAGKWVSNDLVNNVKDYGLKGDSVTNDATLLQSVIDLSAATKATVFVPRGIYLLNSTITIKGSFICEAGVKFIKNHNGNGFYISSNNVYSEYTVSNIQIQPSSTYDLTGIGLSIKDAPRLRVENYRSIQCGTGLKLDNVIAGNFSNIRLDRNSLAIDLTNGSNANVFTQTDLLGNNGTTVGVRFTTGTYLGSFTNKFVGGHIEFCNYPVEVTGATVDGIEFDNIYFESNLHGSKLASGKNITYNNCFVSGVPLVDEATFGAKNVTANNTTDLYPIGLGNVNINGAYSNQFYGNRTNGYNIEDGDVHSNSVFTNVSVGKNAGSYFSFSGAGIKNWVASQDMTLGTQWIGSGVTKVAGAGLSGLDKFTFAANASILHSPPTSALANKTYTFQVLVKGTGKIRLTFSDNVTGQAEKTFNIYNSDWTVVSISPSWGASSTNNTPALYVTNVGATSLDVMLPMLIEASQPTAPIARTRINDLSGFGNVQYYNLGQQVTVYGATVPTTQTWNAGDKVINTNPSNGIREWVCTVGGASGTWVASDIFTGQRDYLTKSDSVGARANSNIRQQGDNMIFAGTSGIYNFFGLGNGGALQFGNDAINAGVTHRFGKLGMVDNNGNFTPTALWDGSATKILTPLVVNATTANGSYKIAVIDSATGEVKQVSVATVSNAGVAGVSTFNGRAGTVIPQANDYAVADISGLAAALGAKADASSLSNYLLKTDSTLYSTKANVTKVRDSLQANVNLKAPLASPVFTGTPKIGSDTVATKAYARSVGGTGGGVTLTDNLTTTTTGTALDAHQGYVIKNTLDAYNSRIAALESGGGGGSGFDTSVGYKPQWFGVKSANHPLYLDYGNLAAAQVDFPNARDPALQEQEDVLGWQLMVDYILYSGQAKTNNITLSSSDNFILDAPIYLNYGYPFLNSSGGTNNWAELHIKGNGAKFSVNNAYGIFIQGLRQSSIEDITVAGGNGGIPKNGGGCVYCTNALDQANYITPYGSAPTEILNYTDTGNRYNPPANVIVDGFSDVAHTNHYPIPDISKSPWVSRIAAVADTSYKWEKNESSGIDFYGLSTSSNICGLVIGANGGGRGNMDFIKFKQGKINGGCKFFACMYGFSAGSQQMRLTDFEGGNFDQNWVGVELGKHGDQHGLVTGFKGTHFSGGSAFHSLYPVYISTELCYSESLGRWGDIGNGSEMYDKTGNWRFGHSEMDFVPLWIIKGGTFYGQNTYIEGSIMNMRLDSKRPILDNSTLNFTNAFQWDFTEPFTANYNSYRKWQNSNPIYTNILSGIEFRGTTTINTIGYYGGVSVEGGIKASSSYLNQPHFKYVQAGSQGLRNDYMYSNIAPEGNYINFADLTWTGAGSATATMTMLGGSTVNIGDIVKEGDVFISQQHGVEFKVKQRVVNVLTLTLLNGFRYVGGGGDRHPYEYEFDSSNTYSATPALLGIRNTDVNWYVYSSNYKDVRPTVGAVSGTTISTVAYSGYNYTDYTAESQWSVGDPIIYYTYSGSIDNPTSKWEHNVVTAVDATAHTITIGKTATVTGSNCAIISRNPLPQ
jgi:hypothetical protein